MDIAFHIGAHCTDDGQLLKSLLRNGETLAEHGVSVPGPGRYRDLLGDVSTKFRGAVLSTDSQDALLEAILDGETPDRMILSSDSFLSMRDRSYADGRLYPRAFKAAWLRDAFADHDVSFHLAIRDPASFLPALWRSLGPERPDFPRFLGAGDPRGIRWSETIGRIRAAVPDCPIHVWFNEDSPLVWPEVLHDITGLDREVKLNGGFDVLRKIMTEEGMKRLRAYTKAHPPPDPVTRRRIVSAFLDKFAVPGAIEEELDLPGWTDELVTEMTEIYETDLAAIREIPDVVLLTP